MKYLYLILFSFLCLLGCKNNLASVDLKDKIKGPSKVTLEHKEGKYRLFVDNEPFYINGAGLELGNVLALAKHNGNSFRTWRTENGSRSALEVLDEAYANGLMVSMGIDVAKERHGFNYDDQTAVKEQLENIKQEIMPLKDHPALLLWVIGNELNLNYTNPKVWDAVNEISEMIHEIDPNHLTTTTLAGISKREINFIKERCSDLDVLSLQMYGDLPNLPKLVREFGWDRPYIVTEWGATGHWEVPKTSWGAPIEENSTVKAANYLKRYKGGIEADSLQCLGSYVFLWGNKQERTPTWYGIFLEDGRETESVDVMHYIWNKKWPENRTPQIESFTLNDKTAYESVILEEGNEYKAYIKINDFENDLINYKWEILFESTDLKDGGDREERPDAVVVEIIQQSNGEFVFKSPGKGKYRLFVYADDGHGHAATSNIPFMIE